METATQINQGTPDNVNFKAGYKKTKIGWIPEDWDLVKLGDLFEFKNGINADKSAYGTGVCFINVMEVINNNYITYNDIPGSLIVTESQLETFKVSKGDVLFNRTSETPEEIGLSAVYLDDTNPVFGGFVIRGISKDNSLHESFKKDCFNSGVVRKQIIVRGQGAVRANIGQKDLQSVLLPLPPFEEQQKIAEILSTWDKAIQLTQNLIEKLKLRKKGLMQQLLTGTTRLKGFYGEWKEVKLGEYFTQRNETNHTDLPLLSVGINGVYPQDESEKKDTSNSDKSKHKRICIGDIGYNTMRMWQGRSALSSIEGIVSPAYTIVTHRDNADSLFFSYLFKLDYVVHRFYRNSQGLVSDTWQCRFKDFSMVKVNCPPSLEEQKAIAKVLTTADNEIKIQENYLAQLQAQKKGLMQQLLTGEKRVKV